MIIVTLLFSCETGVTDKNKVLRKNSVGPGIIETRTFEQHITSYRHIEKKTCCMVLSLQRESPKPNLVVVIVNKYNFEVDEILKKPDS